MLPGGDEEDVPPPKYDEPAELADAVFVGHVPPGQLPSAQLPFAQAPVPARPAEALEAHVPPGNAAPTAGLAP